MGKKLAIRGHSTRGNEIIALLEMMGGYADDLIGNGTDEKYAYFILKDENNAIDGFPIDKKDEFDFDTQIFTLEEFLEKYPYKIGDKIPAVWGNPCTVKSMSWDENYKTVMYGFEETIFVVRGDELYVNNIINNHTESTKMKNVLAELLEHIKTTSKEELEREFEEIKEWSNIGPTIEEFMTFCESVNKKPTYPANYDECKAVLQLQDSKIQARCGYEWRLISYFQQLLMCRDAYWKVAGEQMGLDKPWEPDEEDEIFIIGYNRISGIYKSNGICTDNFILSFPTVEMRDAFYENFKDLIETCKELL